MYLLQTVSFVQLYIIRILQSTAIICNILKDLLFAKMILKTYSNFANLLLNRSNNIDMNLILPL